MFVPPVPLKGVEVQLQVKDHVASVVSTLHYDNTEDKPIEAVFVFPLPGDAAVCHFSATVGSKQIVAEVKEKQRVSSICIFQDTSEDTERWTIEMHDRLLVRHVEKASVTTERSE